MMHCTTDDLLALRAGEASVWAREHARVCGACGAELEALYQRVAQLRALPLRRSARDRWPVVRDAVQAGRRRRRGRWGIWSLPAAAAPPGLVVFRPFWTGPIAGAELARVKQEAATLEQHLRGEYPQGPRRSAAGAAPA